MPKILAELLAALPQPYHLTGDPNTLITAPVVESDVEVQSGGVFVARKGQIVDGHEFIPRAIERGAAAIVGERPIDNLPVPYVQVENPQEAVGYLAAAYHDFPSRKLVVIGVTGTDGKTTTSTLIHSILQVATGGKAGMISTIAAHVGDKTVETGLHVTTPGAPQVQSLLAQMVANGLTHAVIEMTSIGLAQGRVNGVDIDVAVLTNVTHEHLNDHGSFEAYRAAKGRMFEMLGTSDRKDGQIKIAVINGDDPNADYFVNIVNNAPPDIAFPTVYVLYGMSEAIPHRPINVRYEPSGTYLTMVNWAIDVIPGDDYWKYPEYQTEFFSPLIGQFNVMNMLAAIKVAQQLFGDFAVTYIREGLEAVKSIPGRLERIDEGQDFLAIVDFAHTPNALKNVLETCRKMVGDGGRLIVTFGSAGLRDREKRRMMAETAIQLADFSIFTAEDPRTESLDEILQTMADAAVAVGGVEGKDFIRVPDRGEAIYQACQMAKKGDVVIAYGKGHEQSMAFGNIEYPWDDREAMRAALRGTPLKTLPTAKQE